MGRSLLIPIEWDFSKGILQSGKPKAGRMKSTMKWVCSRLLTLEMLADSEKMLSFVFIIVVL